MDKPTNINPNATNPRLYCIHLNQCDRKKCTAIHLQNLGLVTIRSARKIPRSTVLLDPFSSEVISGRDQELIAARGLVVVDCSWAKIGSNQLDFFPEFSTRRALPPLIAANPVNYGKISKLSSVEALAGALFVVGFEEKANEILEPFPWGPEFLKINRKKIEGLD